MRVEYPGLYVLLSCATRADRSPRLATEKLPPFRLQVGAIGCLLSYTTDMDFGDTKTVLCECVCKATTQGK